MLELWIENALHKRQGQALTNFKETLPDASSDLAHQILKDPYCFDFLTLADDTREKEIESGLMAHIQKFLTELGGWLRVCRKAISSGC